MFLNFFICIKFIFIFLLFYLIVGFPSIVRDEILILFFLCILSLCGIRDITVLVSQQTCDRKGEWKLNKDVLLKEMRVNCTVLYCKIAIVTS